MFGIEQLGPRHKSATGGPERENVHKISSSNDSPSAIIRRDSYTVSYTMVMACTRPQPMSETSAVLGEQRRTLRATDLIFPKWQRELLS
jgi:hypothetical protein